VVIQNAYGTSQPASADGSRFYFNGVHGSEEGVFLREGGATKVVSHPEGEPAKSEPARLFGTSESGRYAFFWSRAQLTSDAPEWTGGESKDGNLYRYDASSGEIEYLAEADVYVQGEAYGEVQRPGNLGISADGQTIYFNQAGQGVSVWHDGVVHSVIPHQLGIGEERASPNGRYFVYWGAGAEGELPIERYDADTNESICVSCLPDGSPVPARLPAQGPDFEISNKTETVVDDSGTVYFDSEAALVSADVNGTRDVYAWYDGRDVLISPGDQPFAASYADASANGRDVFFTTAQQLVQRDTDRSLDVYDARIGGGLPLQNATPSKECERDCKAIVGAGAVAPPAGSEGINGPGNAKSASRPVACKKGWHKIKSKGKAKCVKSHKKQRSHGHKKQRTGKKKGGTR
jgi:hypothetical protein